MKLVVIIRNPAPFVVLQEPMEFRQVIIELTEDQVKALELRDTGWNMGNPITEQFSFCFLEV